MFYIAEEVFVDKFLACLRKLDVMSIPFDNDAFYNGVEQMRQLFQTNVDNLGEISREISMLFIRNPYEGVFARFRDAISEQNGWYISFENPEYVNGILKITLADAENILSEQNLEVPQKYLFDFARAFCEGANITIKQQKEDHYENY